MQPLETASAAPRRRRGPRPHGLQVAAGVVVLVLLSPLVVVALDAGHAGWSSVSGLLLRRRSLDLIGNTVELAGTVAVAAAVLGAGAAVLLERGGLPWRRLWSVLLVLPMAMPDFVVGFAWHSVWPRLSPLLAATAIMTLSTYPLVYLPVSAVLRRSNRTGEEIARGLGYSPVAVLVKVTLPSIRVAMAGGTLLAVLTVISEYGAFEAVRFHTLTTEIFTEFQFDSNAAAALSIPLLVLGLACIGLDAAVPRRAAPPATAVADRPRRWRWWTAVPVAGLAAVVAAGVLFPIGVLIYWMRVARRTTLPAVTGLSDATASTFGYCTAGALAVVVLALPVAVLSVRHPSRWSRSVSAGAYLAHAIPGVIVALSLVYLAVNWMYPLYETPVLVVCAYVVLFFPLGLVCVRATVAQVPMALIEVSHTLGRGPIYTFLRVTLPLVAPGLIAGFCLVFVTATTELTATLLLAPPDVKTLATQFWAFQSESAYSAASPYALVIIAVAVIPGAVLGLWFDRSERSNR
ncbi:iron ABC transporter permease [Gordonia sp. TBRC 11910]|uniref:Iron ABC transporter permease n=1 Tax=Gordonia asplenii TaxID=2725283 RepID=A0A848L8C6_9ACTN|nr:ABC transporter permease subunit [Gordonia asplenii]NMO05215.1 iron ABC transporter permease [Gordonia asplenii]